MKNSGRLQGGEPNDNYYIRRSPVSSSTSNTIRYDTLLYKILIKKERNLNIMIKDLLIRVIKVTKTTKDGTHQYPDYFGIFASEGENHTISIKIAKTAQGFIEANRKNNFIDLKLNISTAKKEEGVNGFYTYVSKKNAEGKYIRVVNKEGEYIPQIVITKLTAFSLSKEVLKQFDKPNTEEKKANEIFADNYRDLPF